MGLKKSFSSEKRPFAAILRNSNSNDSVNFFLQAKLSVVSCSSRKECSSQVVLVCSVQDRGTLTFSMMLM